MSILGFGFNKEKSSTAPWEPQAQYLKDLYGIGQNLFRSQAGAQGIGQGLVDGMMPGLQQGFGAMGGLADPTANIAAQEASLASGLGNLFRNEINPAISGGAVGAGGYGGGRHGVAQGVAAGEIANAYTSGLGQITASANQQAAAAASMMPGMASQIYNLGMGPQQAAWAPALNYSALVGPPVMAQSHEKSGFNIGFG